MDPFEESTSVPDRTRLWLTLLIIATLLVVISLLVLWFWPKHLIIYGNLSDKSGPLPARSYDMRLKFYDAVIKTQPVAIYDKSDVPVGNNGQFRLELSNNEAELKQNTILQVCINNDIDESTPDLPSCKGPPGSSNHYTMMVCSFTPVGASPTSFASWVAKKNEINATGGFGCGTTTTATVAQNDVFGENRTEDGQISSRRGLTLEGTKLRLEGTDNREIDLAPVIDETVAKKVDEKLSQQSQPQSGGVMNVFNTFEGDTIQQGDANTDSQTLSLSGSVLTISGGNSVTLPAGSSGDDVVGNEITNVSAGGGLLRVGSGTTLDPYRVGLQNCADGQVLQFDTGSWDCATLSGAGTNFNVSDGSNSQTVTDAQTVTFVGNQGLAATVSATDTVTFGIVDGGVTTIKVADGNITNAKLAANSVATGNIVNGTITGSDIASGTIGNANLQNSSLTVSPGAGLSGGGLVALGASTTLSLQSCPNGQILKSNGSGYACAADSDTNTDAQTLSFNNGTRELTISGGNTVTIPDADTLYSALAGGGLSMTGNAFSLQTCPVGQILKSTNGTTPTYGCDVDTDTDTTYSAGDGIDITGTTISNTGVLSFNLGSSTALVNSGTAQDLAVDLKACGNGEVLQYSTGVSRWQCASMSGGGGGTNFNISDGTNSQNILDFDTITFVGSGGISATVSGTDTITYNLEDDAVTNAKLDDDAVTSIKIADGTIVNDDIDDATIGNAKLQNSSLTVSPGAGLSGGGTVALGASTTLSLQACPNGQVLKSNGSGYACAADNDTNTDAQTLSFDDGNRELTISGGNTVTIPDADTLYTALSGGGLTLNSTAFSLQTCPVGQLLKSTNASTPAYSCAADTDTNTTYSAGDGIDITGTTISNTGVLSFDVGASTALTNSGTAQDPVIDLKACADNEVLQYDTGASSWDCAAMSAGTNFTISDGTNSQTVADANTITFVGSGGISATVSATDTITYNLEDEGVTSVKIADGTIVDDDLADDAVINAKLADDAVTTDKIANATILFADLAANGCSNNNVIKFNGSAWTCGTDVDTDTDTTNFNIQANAGATQNIAAGNTITFSDGTGVQVSRTGTTLGFALTNTGVSTGTYNNVTVDAQGRVTVGNNVSYLTSEVDGVVGNEVTNVTGSSSGLVRSGSGTAVSPYTLAANVGNGIQITSNAISINSPTCAGTTKLQWNGTAFVCSADVDTNTTYTASNGLTLSGTDVRLGGSLTQNTTIAFGTNNLDMTSTATTGHGMSIAANSLTTGAALQLSSTTASGNNGALAEFDVSSGNGFVDGIKIIHLVDDTQGNGMYINYMGDDSGLEVETDPDAEGDAIQVFNAGTGSGLYVADQLSDTTPFAINDSGEVGIGTDTPSAKLDIIGLNNSLPSNSGTATENGLRIQGSTSNIVLDGGVTDAGGSATSGWLQVRNKTDYGSNRSLLVNPNGGGVFIGTTNPNFTTANFGVNRSTTGNVAAFVNTNGTCFINPTTTTMTCTSDARKKQDINTIGGATALEKIMGLRPSSFHWRTDDSDSPLRYGFIAQDVEKIIPEAVSTQEDGYKTLDINAMTPFIVGALKEQQGQIDELDQRLDKMELAQASAKGGIVSEDTTFKKFVKFEDDVKFADNVAFSKNTAGTVTVKAGQRTAKVTFSRAHSKSPIVNLTPKDLVNGSYRVRSTSKNQFEIELLWPQSRNVTFNWTALVAQP